jgi:serine/threonine-protein kinase
MSIEAGIRGTPAYLSPEALSGGTPSPADDLWSLSVTLLEACTGTNPFKGATVPATVARVLTFEAPLVEAPAALQGFFEVALGMAGERPQNAAQLAQILARAGFIKPV